MNSLPATILAVDSGEGLSLVDARVDAEGGATLAALVLETPATLPWLRVGAPVRLLFKDTEIAVAKGEGAGTSFLNRLPCRVTGVERGKVLARLRLEHAGLALEAVITARSAAHLGLGAGDAVQGLIKATEISLAEPDFDAP